jgi:DUF177 domain-containing protein
MRLNVLQELKQSIGAVSEYELLEPSVAVEGRDLRDLNATLRLLRTDRGLLTRVRGTGTLTEQCSRCLADVACRISIDFEEEFVPVVDASTGLRVHISEDEEDDVFRIGPTFELDLSEALRQYILVSEPIKPLCREACAGLCQECGTDLNTAACQCTPAGDARWSALAGLVGDKREGK